jgi:hypothetical protein
MAQPPEKPSLDDEHRLFLVVHHIAFDFWSWGVLARELAAGTELRSVRNLSGSPMPQKASIWPSFSDEKSLSFIQGGFGLAENGCNLRQQQLKR